MAPRGCPPYLYLVSLPMNCTMHRRVMTAGRARLSVAQWDGTEAVTTMPTGPERWLQATAGVRTVEGVGDEGGSRASDHLSGSLEEKRAVRGRERGRGGALRHPPSSHLLQHLLQ